MGINESIKSYLISLGYEVDSSAYAKFTASLKQAQSAVEKNTNILSSSFAKAGMAYIGMASTFVATTATMLNSLAKADLEYEKTALKLHMVKDAAKQYSIALKVLGEPPEMLAWMPELHKHYVQLRKDAMLMELPEEYGKRMQMVRGIGQEFNRLKQESIYALEWIGFSVVKHLQNPLEKTKWTFESFNQKIIETMPQWTEKIGSKIANLMGIFGNVGKHLKLIIELNKKLWDSFSPTTKALISIGLITFLFSKLGPFGKAMVLFAVLTIVISEFWDMLSGKETLIPREFLQVPIMALDTLYRSMMTVIVLAKSFWSSLAGPGAALAHEKFTQANLETAKEGYEAVRKMEWKKYQELGKKEGWSKDKTVWEFDKRMRETPQYVMQRKGIANLQKQYEEAVKATQATDTDVVMKGFADVEEIWTPGSKKFPGPLGWMVKEHPKGYWSSEEAHAETVRQEKKISGALPSTMPKNVEKYRELAKNIFGENAQFMLRVMAAEGGAEKTISPIKSGKWKGTKDIGLLQINTMHLPDLRKAGIASSIADLQIPETNFRAGKWLLEKQGPAAWNPSRERWGQYISEYKSGGGAASVVNSGNTYEVTINLPVKDLEKNFADKAEKIGQNLGEAFGKAVKELHMPGFTTNDSSGFMPGPPVNPVSLVPSVAGG